MLSTETVLFSGYTVLRTARDGSIEGDQQGLFYRDARVLSTHRLTIDGRRPELVGDSQPESDRWKAVFQVPRPGGSADGPALPQDALELAVERRIGPDLLEDLMVRNHAAVAADVALRIELDADFADSLELDASRQPGGVIREVSGDPPTLRLVYEAQRGTRRARRAIAVAVESAASAAVVEPAALCFELALEARATWRATIRYTVLDDGVGRASAGPGFADRARQRQTWRSVRPQLIAPDPLRIPFERAADDLFDLRNFELERRLIGSGDGSRWVANAGVPQFTGLFGRDVITAGWQSAMLGTRLLRGALDAAAATAATRDDPWRDAEPGKLIHELRSGPLSELGLSPRDAYYGSQTTPAMFVLALSELWHWTGNIDLLRRHRDVAVAALDWADRYGDRDGDGFIEYEKRSPEGLRNQGWKDSDEAIRHEDGSPVTGPIATVEEQAFRILALERLAEIRVALGEDDQAEDDLERSKRLRRSWHERYWMPDVGYYALALDGDKRQVRSITSNPGHALGAGVVPREHARTVADRLLEDGLFSGWGVRSLAADHPSYNPFAYHLGAVWPVELATFALGCKRYGLDEHVDRLSEGLFAAAARSPGSRLPEALSGHARRPEVDPIPYPTANSPQAWSASALIQMLQISLGLYPFAPLHMLAVVRPRLPTGIPELVLRGVRVGGATVDLRFERRADGAADWAVVGRRGPLLVLPVVPPDADPDGLAEAVEQLVMRRAPGRRAQAARIAFGLTGSDGR